MDKELLKFVKLKELVLSANQIKEIDTTNLPPPLKVKEPRFHSGSWSQSCPETLPLPCPLPKRFGHHVCVPRVGPRLLKDWPDPLKSETQDFHVAQKFPS